MVYKHKMRNGKYKEFRSKDAYESWKRGMFGNMQHSGRVRFVSRDELLAKKEAFKKRTINKEVDRTKHSQIVSGRVKGHKSQTNTNKESGETRSKGFRTQATSTDNFEITETEEAGKYTPLNTELKIQEDGDNVTITRISKKDGRIISSTVLRATSPEGIHNFFVELEDKFEGDQSLKLWELRALADHFNVSSGGITVDTLENRLRLHLEGNLDSKFYTRESKEAQPVEQDRILREEQNIDPDAIEVTPDLYDKPEKPKTSISDDLHDSPQMRQSESLIEKSLKEPSLHELLEAGDEENIVEGTMDDPTLNDPDGEQGMFEEALETQKPLIDTNAPTRRNKRTAEAKLELSKDEAQLMKSVLDEKKANLKKKERQTKSDEKVGEGVEPESQIRKVDKEGNNYLFWKDENEEIILKAVIDRKRQNISGKFTKDQIAEKLDISKDFDVDYEELKD